jgi:hypothetical protein
MNLRTDGALNLTFCVQSLDHLPSPTIARLFAKAQARHPRAHPCPNGVLHRPRCEARAMLLLSAFFAFITSHTAESVTLLEVRPSRPTYPYIIL